MEQVLSVLPDSKNGPVTRIAVDVERNLGHLTLRYTVAGAIDDLLLPAFAASGRTDELWPHTCFEVFVRPVFGNAYYEFNFAPSTQWAAYQFTGTREGMYKADAAPSCIEAEQDAQSYALSVVLDLSRLDALSDEAPLRLNLSAVIEEANGRKSYWALAHPADKPDFHNPDCFTLELPAA